MSKGIKYLIGLAVFVLVMIGCVIGYNNLAEKYQPESVAVPEDIVATPAPEEETGEASEDEAESSILAPDFTVTSTSGEQVSLSSMQGKPVVLNFWATWCGPCTGEMPHFQTLYEEYGGEVEFMLVNLTDGAQETQEDVLEFLEEKGYTFPVYYDTGLAAASVYGIYSIPTTFFISADGELLFYQLGAMSEDTLRGAIETLLGE